MPARPKRHHRTARLRPGLLVITSMVVITLDLRGAGIVASARTGVETATAPLRSAVDAIKRPVEQIIPTWADVDGVRAERDRLRAQLRVRRGAPTTESIAEQQLAALLAAQDLPWVSGIDRTVARVTAGPRSNLSPAFEIDKGADDGVVVGMPVLAGIGLVGRIDRVSDSSSVVQLVTDPAIRVGVKLVPEGPFGTVRGGGDGIRLVVDTPLPSDGATPVGLQILTTGGPGSAYPPGIPVGIATGGRSADNGITLEVFGEASDELSRLDFVTVLLWRGEG